MKWLQKFWDVGNSSIIIIIMFLTKFNPIGWFEKYFPKGMKDKLNDESLRLSVNSAIVFVVFHLFFSIFNKPISIKTNVSNISGTKTTTLPIGGPIPAHLTKILYLDISIDYKSKFLKWVVELFGGACIYVNIPRITTLQIDNSIISSFQPGTIINNQSSEYIKINLNNILSRNEIRTDNLRLTFDAAANSTVPRDGILSTEIRTFSDKRILNFIINGLISFDKSEHLIQCSF